LTTKNNIIKWINAGKAAALVDAAKNAADKKEFVAFCDDKDNGYNPALVAIGKHFGLAAYGSNRKTLCGNLYDLLSTSKEARAQVRNITSDNRTSPIPIVRNAAATAASAGRAKGTRTLKAGLEHTELLASNYDAFAARAKKLTRQEFVADCRELKGRIEFVREAIKHVTPDGKLHGFPPQTQGSTFNLYCGLFWDRVHGVKTPGAGVPGTGKKSESKGDSKRSVGAGSKKGASKKGAGAGAGRKRFQDLYPEDDDSEPESGLELTPDIYGEDEESESDQDITPTPVGAGPSRRFRIMEVENDENTPSAGAIMKKPGKN
jgi:hypothetical protein